MTGRSACCSSASAAETLAGSGGRTKRRHARETWLDQRLELGFIGIDLTFVAAKLQVHRARCAAHRDPERLPHHVGEARHVVDGGVELGDRLERRHVVDLLIDLAELGRRLATPGESDHRRVGEVGVPQARGQIERADHLRHADARLAGGAGVAVRHVGGGLFPMGMDTRDRGPPFHLGECAAQHGRHHEHVGDAVGGEHLGEALRPAHAAVVSVHAERIATKRSGRKARRQALGLVRQPTDLVRHFSAYGPKISKKRAGSV